ncbi:MAG: LysM peptidoglycan-binding domain-containing protein [Clostridia bacterium]|nr:LysM peptidoglycan-binding domain-containing protein [Clostridia bacterium]
MIPPIYIVKKGQSVEEIAKAFDLPVSLIVAVNGLTAPVQAGDLLLIPQGSGNLYSVKAGEDKALLCGSEERYAEKNKTERFYPGQKIFL